MKRFLVLLTPVGALLVLAMSSLTAYRVLEGIAALMDRNTFDGVSIAGHAVGQLGLILFGIGFLQASRMIVDPDSTARQFLSIASISFGLAAILVVVGTLILNAGFRNLATAASIDSVMLLDDIRPARYVLLLGWLLFAVAAGCVAAASLRSSPPESNPACPRRGMATATFLTCMIFFLAAIQSVLSLRSCLVVLEDNTVEPSRLADVLLGTIRSPLLAFFGIAACAVIAWYLRKVRPPQAASSPS